jgi:multiple antibiotic resistance protein
VTSQIENVNFTRVLLVAFTTLFPVVNPIGCAPIFLSMAQRYSQSARQILSRKIGAYSFVILAVSLVFGTPLLNFFGITIPVIEIAGGLVLGATGWKLLNEKEDSVSESQTPATLEDALEHAFYPLTLPITVGPGCISIAIILGAHLRHEAGTGLFGGVPRHFIAALIGMFLLCVLVTVCYGNAERLVRRLGKTGASILMRLSSFVLFAIGVQIFWNGLSAGVPQILGKVPGP